MDAPVAGNVGVPEQKQLTLSYIVVEGGFGDRLYNMLERNYLDSRNHVFSLRDMKLMTPLRFLDLICTRLETKMHCWTYEFRSTARDVQYRTEMYAGRFCGVAHAITKELSAQLAAAHVLERIKLYLKPLGLGACSYALFPGSRHTKLEQQMEDLLSTFYVGPVNYTVKDLRSNREFIPGDVRFECCCNVRNQEIKVLHDSMHYGKCYAAAQMFEMQSERYPSLKKHIAKDYYAVGAECPTSLQLNLRLSDDERQKVEWMAANQVENVDTCLHDPDNTSKYLDDAIDGDGTFAKSDEGIRFKTDFERVLREIKDLWNN